MLKLEKEKKICEISSNEYHASAFSDRCVRMRLWKVSLENDG